MTSPTRNPLSWPTGWPRTPEHKRVPTRFSQGHYSNGSMRTGRRDLTLSTAIQRLQDELDKLRATDTLMSSNLKAGVSGVILSGQAEPRDCAVAVYFKLKGHERVLACDRYTSAAGNIAAIAAHIDALRRIDRYGVGTIEQAFAGYASLPAPSVANRPLWRAVLCLAPVGDVTKERINEAYRTLAREAARSGNPDYAEHKLLELNLARDAAFVELGVSK